MKETIVQDAPQKETAPVPEKTANPKQPEIVDLLGLKKPETPETKTSSKKEEIANLLTEFTTELPPEKRKYKPRKSKDSTPVTPAQPAPAPLMIPPKVAGIVCDRAMSMITALGNNFFDKKGTKIESAWLNTSDKDLETLMPAVEAMVRSWDIDKYPTLYCLGSLFILKMTTLTALKTVVGAMQKMGMTPEQINDSIKKSQE